MEKGIKESKELLQGVMTVAGVMVSQLKDGFQLTDLPSIFSRLGYNKKIQTALEGVKEIPSEIKDLDTSEIIELSMVIMAEVPLILSGLKK